MRRASATLLLAVFATWLIGPVLQADPESNLPACCRRDGKHHCGMLMAPESAGTPVSGPAIGQTRAKCPFYPNGAALLPYPQTALVVAANPAGAFILIQGDAPSHAVFFGHKPFDDAQPKRGPPPSLLN